MRSRGSVGRTRLESRRELMSRVGEGSGLQRAVAVVRSWTAAALLPLPPSTACCGDFSQVPPINSQQQAAETKAAAGLPQSRES